MLKSMIIVSALVTAQLLTATPRKLTIVGEVQSWQRDCTSQPCSLPAPTSAKKVFRLQLTESAAPQSVASDKAVIDLGAVIIELEYFWVSKLSRPDLTKGYISIQQKLYKKEGHQLLAEGGQYRADRDDAVIPVGFIASPIVNGRQIGVTFTRVSSRR